MAELSDVILYYNCPCQCGMQHSVKISIEDYKVKIEKRNYSIDAVSECSKEKVRLIFYGESNFRHGIANDAVSD